MLTPALRIVGALLGGIVHLWVVLFLVSWALHEPVDRAAFFAERASSTDGPVVFAHQGGGGIRPENTMIAFRHAVAVGAGVLDTDMHMTSDGALVLIHDETVDRTTGGTGAVRDLTLAQLRQLDFAHGFSSDGGATHPYRGQGHGIVTVDELFTEFDGMRFGIEIKQTGTGAAAELCTAIKRFGYEERVLVSSFGQENMDAFRDACPSVATSATEGEVRTFLVLNVIRLGGLSTPSFDALQVPEERSGVRILRRSFVDAAMDRHLPLVPWTIDDVDGFDRMIALGVYGINTNHPDRLVDHLAERS